MRTLDPLREIDQDVKKVLKALSQDPNRNPGLPSDEAIAFELQGLTEQRRQALISIDLRRKLNCELADFLDRKEAVLTARRNLGHDTEEETPENDRPTRRSLLLRTLDWLFRKRSSRTRSSKAEPKPKPIGMTLSQIEKEISRLRLALSQVPAPRDPVDLTNRIAKLTPPWIARFLACRCSLNSDEAAALFNEAANIELHGEKELDRALTETVLNHRPLWLASVLGTPRRIGLHDRLFDLVIFDEASQCDIGSALPLLARARRAVIVGDAEQLAFISQVGAAQDRNLMAAQGLPVRGMGRYAQGGRSLFDLANYTPGAAKITLRDQYRSAEEIVGYINDEFYNGKLRVSADANGFRVPTGRKPGLDWTHVQPRRSSHANSGNVNPAEVDAITVHLRSLLVEQGYQGSVGVISPFRNQVQALANSLATALPRELSDRAELRVGTVDAFQGQERDLILFSPTVHAGSAPSAITFLNRDHRRLNVAISRARAVAHVFGDRDFARSGKIRRLASLLDRIENPRSGLGEGVYDSNWERVVDAELRRRKLRFEPQYPVAGRRLDFAVFGDHGVKLDLEVDGRRWHQDTDGNRKLDDHWRDHQMLSLGWKVRRFWVDELQKDLEGCIDLVEQDILG